MNTGVLRGFPLVIFPYKFFLFKRHHEAQHSLNYLMKTEAYFIIGNVSICATNMIISHLYMKVGS